MACGSRSSTPAQNCRQQSPWKSKTLRLTEINTFAEIEKDQWNWRNPQRMTQTPWSPLVYWTHLINHCIRLSHFPNTWKEAKVITLPKHGKDPKFAQNLRPISLLSTTGKLFEKVILTRIQWHIEEWSLNNGSHFGSLAHHSTTLQCMRLTDQESLIFNNNMSTAEVFLDNEKPSTIHDTLVCCINYVNWNFRRV
jgi:hypothetical protein